MTARSATLVLAALVVALTGLRGCLVTAATPGDGRATRPARFRPAS